MTQAHVRTHAWTCRQKCKDAKKWRKTNGGTKQAKQAYYRTEQREVCLKQTNIMEIYLTSNFITISHKREGCNHKANGPKDQQAQAHEGSKAWQEPKSSQINIDTKHRSKQAYTCIKEMIQTLWYRPRCMDLGLDHKI